jgi:hypothetical protein
MPSTWVLPDDDIIFLAVLNEFFAVVFGEHGAIYLAIVEPETDG